MQFIFYVYIRFMESSSNFKSYLQRKYGSASLAKRIILARRKKYHTRIYNSYQIWQVDHYGSYPIDCTRSRYQAALHSWYALRLIIRLAAST